MDLGIRIRRPRRGALLAVLAMATAGGCDDDLAPPFSIEGTGAVEGLVFFDAAEDGLYDPADGDYAVPDVVVAVRNRGTTDAFGGGASGPDGRFRVEQIPPGTHDLFIDEGSVPEGVNICQNPLRVTVNIMETRYQQVQGRPGCLITIQEAKDLPTGEFVVVRGAVTSSPGQIEAGFTYMQDQTGGLFVFGSSLQGMGIAVGDQIELGGTTTIFSGQFELTGPELRDLVPGVGAPAPLLVTTAEIAASGSDPLHAIQNLFIRVEGAELTTQFGADGLNIQNGIIDDGSGAVQIRVDDGVANRNELTNLFSPGTCYDINGFGVNFNGTGQIFPRSLDDIEEVPCT